MCKSKLERMKLSIIKFYLIALSYGIADKMDTFDAVMENLIIKLGL